MTSFRFGDPSRGAAWPSAPAARAFDLFATRIWQIRLPALAERLPEWTAILERLRAASPIPAGRTNRGGWNSSGYDLLEQLAFADLNAIVRAQCESALAEMGARDLAFRLQAWANIHDRGGFNFMHLHNGCLLSGTFYVQVPPGSGNLVFRDPRPGALHGVVQGSGPNAWKDVHLHPEAGLMVLFPHWLEHGVEVHDSDTPRVSIAFNAVAKS